MAGMLYGPFGVPKGAKPRLAGMHEMGEEHGCTMFAHSLETGRIGEQIGVEPSKLTPLTQGQRLPLGQAGELEVLHTPGHSGGSICIVVRPKQPGSRPHCVIVGDTLFPGSCGRLDLDDSDVSAMFESLKKLQALDDATKVYPGHGYSGDSTTIGKEKVQGLLVPFSKQEWMQMMKR